MPWVVAIDGKVIRRSFDRASGKSALHMVGAWGCEQRMVLAQIATDAKSNEITAVPKLLEMLSLKGTIVTTDALNCQRAIAQLDFARSRHTNPARIPVAVMGDWYAQFLMCNYPAR